MFESGMFPQTHGTSYSRLECAPLDLCLEDFRKTYFSWLFEHMVSVRLSVVFPADDSYAWQADEHAEPAEPADSSEKKARRSWKMLIVG